MLLSIRYWLRKCKLNYNFFIQIFNSDEWIEEVIGDFLKEMDMSRFQSLMNRVSA